MHGLFARSRAAAITARLPWTARRLEYCAPTCAGAGGAAGAAPALAPGGLQIPVLKAQYSALPRLS